jgi:uncharacterized membrane protein (UPF0127 family)
VEVPKAVSFLRNARTGAIIATRIDRLTGFLQRAIGLLGRSGVRRDEGVWIPACRAIHTIGMRADIDVIFVDRQGCVLRLEGNVEPNRWSLSCLRAADVVELGGGALRQMDVLIGDRLELVSSF